MAVRGKFWQGDVAAKLIFPLSNDFTQNKEKAQGICTAASLAWAKACLKLGRFVNTWDEIGTSKHNLNIVMATLRYMDANPVGQTELAGVKSLSGGVDGTATSIKDVIEAIKVSEYGIGIFWNSYHTMGYGYSHKQKDLFDMNYGLFRAKYSKGIQAKIEELYGDDIIGYRIIGKL